MHFPLLATLSLIGLMPFLVQSAPTSPATKLCNPQVSYDGAMNAVFKANKEHYPYIRAAAREFDMCDRKRFAAFVGQIAHETGRLTTLYQPKDEGAGALHMLPSNWKFAFEYLAKTHPDLVKGLAGDYKRTDAVASKIMQLPEVAYIVAGWWFDSGASYVLHNKCTGMSKFADKLSDDGKWTKEDEEQMNLIGSCVFGMNADEGASQRREFIKAAFDGFVPVIEPPKSTTTTTTTMTTVTTTAATTTTIPATTTTPAVTTTTSDAITTSTQEPTTSSIPTATESKTQTVSTTTASTASATTSTQSHVDDKTSTKTTAATATQTSTAIVPPTEPTHAYGKRPTKPGKPAVEPTVVGTEPSKPADQVEPVYGKRPVPKKEEDGDKKGDDKKPIQGPAKCY